MESAKSPGKKTSDTYDLSPMVERRAGSENPLKRMLHSVRMPSGHLTRKTITSVQITSYIIASAYRGGKTMNATALALTFRPRT
jgi:hypothetical protein